MSAPDRRAMLDRADGALSVRRQCALLGVARSGVYRARKPANDNDAGLMRRIDELFTAWPFLGSRRMTAMLRAEGMAVNRKRVQRLDRRARTEAENDQTCARPQDLSFLLRNHYWSGGGAAKTRRGQLRNNWSRSHRGPSGPRPSPADPRRESARPRCRPPRLFAA